MERAGANSTGESDDKDSSPPENLNNKTPEEEENP